MSGELQLALLGNAEICLDGVPVRGFRSSKTKALLFYLAVTGASHSRPALAGLFWADKPEIDARMNLRKTLTNLRKLVGSHLNISRQTVAFNRNSSYWLDVEVFEASVGGSSTKAATESLPEAVDLYRGDFLEGFYVRGAPMFEEWTLSLQTRFRELVIQALHTLIVYYSRQGKAGLASGIEYATRLLVIEPWQEEAHRHLMLLLARSGQHSAALAQFESCRQVLFDELGVQPANETTALYERIRVARRTRRHNLPVQPTPFVGREIELTEITRHLANPECRMLTLVGPGGIGKTRLALQVATINADLFLHGVTFVSLAPVSQPEHLVLNLADALNFSFSGPTEPEVQLFNYLQEREVLLLLDNFEHILDGVNLLAELLIHAPQVKLLVTSRERLNLRWEWLFDLQGLAYPEIDSTQPLERYSAVQLFLQNAQRARLQAPISETEKPCIGQICRLIEGLPLGIELAAAMLREHSCATIAAAIETNLQALNTSLRDLPKRHRSLQATVAYSWDRLSAVERTALKKLSVFRKGFRMDAALQVTGASLLTLSSLVNKSLLRKDSSKRYTMHEMIRQYAAAKLDESSKEKVITQDQHCRYYTTLLHDRGSHLKGGKQKKALAEISAEIENVRSSWQWALAQGMVEEIGQSIEGLYHFYEIRSWFPEGEATLGKAAERLQAFARSAQGRQQEEQRNSGDYPEQKTQAQIILGKVLARQGGLCHRLVLYDKAREVLQQSLSIFHQVGPRAKPETSFPLLILGNIASELGDDAQAEQYFQESFAEAKEARDQWGIGCAVGNLGIIALKQEHYEEARQLEQESLAIFRAISDQWGMVFGLNCLGEIAYKTEEYAEAKRMFEEALTVAESIEHQLGIMESLHKLGKIACVLADYQEARQYLFKALEMALDMGLTGSDEFNDNLLDVASFLIASEDGDEEQAAELLTFVLNHSASLEKTKQRAKHLLAQVESQLPHDALAQAQARGRIRTLDAMMANILSEPEF